MNTRWAESEVDFLRKYYTHLPTADIAAQLNRSYEGIRHKAATIGVQRKAHSKKFTPEEDNILRERYTTSSMVEMVALLGRHHNSIRHRAHILGMTNAEQIKRATIANEVQHDYFSKIDSHIKAYLLGLLAADGSIGSADNSIKLKVGAKDRELPELFRNEISPQSVIHTYIMPPLPGYTKIRKVAACTVSSAQMKTDLGTLGVIPCKTFTLQWPSLESQFVASFILGYFDGDGTIQYHGLPWTWRWEIYSASESFLVAVHNAIYQHTGLDPIWNLNKRRLPALRLNGGRTVQVIDAWLHANITGLWRKRLPAGAYDHARQDIQLRRREQGRRKTLSHYSLDALEHARHLRAEGLTLDQVAAITGINRSTVYRWTKPNK